MKIYSVKLSDISEQEIHELSFFISSEKRQKIRRLINKEDKIRSLIGDLLIRTVLIDELNIPNHNLIFDINLYGKPFLINYPNINFNLSHSGDYVVCAFDCECIGIDIEEIKNIDFIEIAKNFFTSKEYYFILNQKDHLQLETFYEIWTSKESYIKCRGQGLSISLNSFDVDRYHNKEFKIFDNIEYNEYFIKFYNLDFNYKLAICSRNREFSEYINKMDNYSLVKKFISSII